MRRPVRLGALAAAATIAACGSTPEDGGPTAIEAMVLASCAPSGDPVETEVCECAYTELGERFDAEELERLDRELLDDPDTVPAEVREVALACGFERISPPTTKPPVETSTTTTTRPAVSSTSTTRLP